MTKYRVKIQYVVDVEAPTMAQAVIQSGRHIPDDVFNVTAEAYIPREKPAATESQPIAA